MFKNFWTQASKKAMLKDVKKRLVDHLKAGGITVTEGDLRLWLYTHDKLNTENHLRTRAAQVAEGFKNPP